MGLDQTVIAVGIGCRKDCPADEVVTLVRATLAIAPVPLVAGGLFSIAAKRGEAGLAHAAAMLGLPLTFLDREILSLFAGAASSCSRRVEDLFGLPSVAETAALAGAGRGAALLVPRRMSASATCAVAGPPAHA